MRYSFVTDFIVYFWKCFLFSDKVNKDAAQYEICLTPFQSHFAYIFVMEHLSKDTPLTNSINGCEQQLFLHFPGAPSLNLLRTPVLSANSGQTLLTTQFITESSGSQGGRPSSLAEPASYQVCKKIKPCLHQKI